jgi:hypothetical protein
MTLFDKSQNRACTLLCRDENDEEDKQSTPDELQLENVDMNDLKWIHFIPKEYYWETGNYSTT